MANFGDTIIEGITNSLKPLKPLHLEESAKLSDLYSFSRLVSFVCAVSSQFIF
jgi:hypothetical protein